MKPNALNGSGLSVLASDMDGTFIPLEGNDQNRRDLTTLADELTRRSIELVYVTGRHYELACEAIRTENLPVPRWLICDVGTSIYHRDNDKEHSPVEAYSNHLDEITGDWNVERLARLFAADQQLQLQEPEKQGRSKLSYYCDAAGLKTIHSRLIKTIEASSAPYQIIASVDPFTGDGLIDFLPKNVSKAFALSWWVDHAGHDHQNVIFAGDSGNDLAALTAGYRSIVVGNADRELADQVQRVHRESGWNDRLCLAQGRATSGVLEGLRYFAQSE